MCAAARTRSSVLKYSGSNWLFPTFQDETCASTHLSTSELHPVRATTTQIKGVLEIFISEFSRPHLGGRGAILIVGGDFDLSTIP
jgi:hypothetical protein